MTKSISLEEYEQNLPEDLTKPEGIGDAQGTEMGSGARYNTGKVQFGLVPLEALEDCARVFEHGAAKYSVGNWERGMSWRAVYECLIRHMSAWQAGEDLDIGENGSGLPHLAHAMCNLIMLTKYAETYPEGDDRVSTIIARKEEQNAE